MHVVQHAPWLRGGASRIVFKPLADDFGEAVVLILDYVGPAIATFMTLRHREASLRGPVRAALSLTGHCGDGVSKNTLRNIFHDGFLEDLSPDLRIIDQQQRGTLAGSHVLALVLHTRTLRHEFLQALLQNQVLQPGPVIFFGGGLP